ncbi:MAG: HU family DNA-binding protein, partial [Deltaproteobacteria bacterium]
MIKSGLVEKVAERVKNFTKRDVEIVVDEIFDSMTVSLAKGDKIEIRGFGSFKVKGHKARKGRNP